MSSTQALAWDQSLRMMMGWGKTYNSSQGVSNLQFSNEGFVMGGEYSNTFTDNGLLAWSGGLLLNETVYGGFGVIVGPARLLANFGYGLKDINAPQDPDGLSSRNMGGIYGASAEVNLWRNLGLSFNYLSSPCYLFGLSIHF